MACKGKKCDVRPNIQIFFKDFFLYIPSVHTLPWPFLLDSISNIEVTLNWTVKHTNQAVYFDLVRLFFFINVLYHSKRVTTLNGCGTHYISVVEK